MREKREKPVALADVLAASRGSAALRSRMKEWRLLDRWQGLFGDSIAAHARPARWEKGTLIVRVEHSGWMQELSFLKAQMTERLQQEFPASGIKAIRFELGELPPLPPRLERQLPLPSIPLTDDESQFVEQAIDRIADEGVRDAARRAMGRGLARKRSRG